VALQQAAALGQHANRGKAMKLWKMAGLAVLGSALAFGGAWAQGKKWDTVRIATEGAYAPWNFSGPGGKLDGFEVELANELCGRMKVKCEIVAQDWDGIIPALQAKKYDAIMAGMNINAEREKVLQFSRAYASGPNGLLVDKNGPLAKLPGTGQVVNLASQGPQGEAAMAEMKKMLKGKTIGVQVSTIHSRFADTHYKDVATIREYKTTEQHDLDLAAGRIDAALAEVSAHNATLDKAEFKDKFVVAGTQFRGGDILGRGVAVGLRKEDGELKAMFDKAIGEALADGTLKKLADKWFKADMAPAT
jgi:octopine/nopaline transport system substrate-binding protein